MAKLLQKIVLLMKDVYIIVSKVKPVVEAHAIRKGQGEKKFKRGRR